MNTQQKPSPQQNAVQALESPDPSVRLRAALEMGKHPDPEHLDALVGRCAVEPDFYVRDMLTWAITRLPSHSTLPRLRRELGSETAQARSQALHTLSKIGDRSAWPWVSRMLRDPDCEVARTAWRSAAALVPDDARRALAVELAGQLGRGDRSLQRSLSRSLIELGPVLDEVLAPVAGGRGSSAAVHARATMLMRDDPEIGFDAALHDARLLVPVDPDPAPTDGSAG